MRAWLSLSDSMDEDTRKAEFGHLQGVTYLDHAGATLYAKSQLEAHVTNLATNLYGNPHSQSPSSQLTTAAVDHARESVLQFFGTDSSHYDVVFTSGCTGALKLLGESFPWHCRKKPQPFSTPNMSKAETAVFYTRDFKKAQAVDNSSSYEIIQGSVFCYLEDNHTSVVGMREVAVQCGARAVCVAERDIISSSQFEIGTTLLKSGTPHTEPVPSNCTVNDISEDQGCSNQREIFNLFAYPAQSNFSGQKYPLSWAADIQNGQLFFSGLHPPTFPKYPSSSWKICLDAASFVATNPLDLSKFPIDFVTLSFYKMFGFPTGLGALLVRKDNSELLHKSYFGGGSVLSTVSRTGLHVSRQELHERLEDGTIPFLEILALQHGFQTLSRLAGPMTQVSEHTFSLAKYVHDKLSAMRHFNGSPVCLFYCDGDFTDPCVQGAIVNFNLLRANGDYVGYTEVANLACVHDIHLRTGCFCNTGACMIHLHMDTAQILRHMEAGHVCGDDVDLVDGRPTGSVRISFGYMSTFRDADKFVSFVEENFKDTSRNVYVGGGITSDVMDVNAHVIGGNCNDVVDEIDVVREDSVLSNGERKNSCEDSTWQECVEEEEREKEVREEDCGEVGIRTPRMISVGDQVTATSSGSAVCTGVLNSISLYPVKSCGAMQVSEWLIGGRGLQCDREWVVLSEHRACLSQKQEPRLCLIRPYVHSDSQELELQYEGWSPLRVPITPADSEGGKRASEQVVVNTCHMTVCGDRVSGADCGEPAAKWLTTILKRDCRLVRQCPDHLRRVKTTKAKVTKEGPLLSLANEAQYLLVNRSSVKQLLSVITKKHPNQPMTEEELVSRFRPNLVVSGNGIEPYSEDQWNDVIIGDQKFQVVGKCSRCRTVCVDQRTGLKSSEPLQTLMELRGSRATFGIYLVASSSTE